MIQDKKVVVIMPAYNAQQTLRRTYCEVMAQGVVDQVIVVDDASHDETAQIAADLKHARLHVHEQNRGYGANQKTCYRLAIEEQGDIVIMVHPDYQYTPKLIPAMAGLLGSGLYDCVLGSRVLGGQALRGGMPWWRFAANRFLTVTQNLVLGAHLSEYHTGYRGFTREVLNKLPLQNNSDDFVFDNQMLLQVLWYGYRIGEISCPTHYASDASSISFLRSVKYGFGCLKTAAEFLWAKIGASRSQRFPRGPRSDEDL